jgi:hypothetical protein
LVETQPKEIPMTISLPGFTPLAGSGEVSAGIDPLALPTIRVATGSEGTIQASTAAGDFFVDWQLALATGAQW